MKIVLRGFDGITKILCANRLCYMLKYIPTAECLYLCVYYFVFMYDIIIQVDLPSIPILFCDAVFQNLIFDTLKYFL